MRGDGSGTFQSPQGVVGLSDPQIHTHAPHVKTFHNQREETSCIVMDAPDETSHMVVHSVIHTYAAAICYTNFVQPKLNTWLRPCAM